MFLWYMLVCTVFCSIVYKQKQAIYHKELMCRLEIIFYKRRKTIHAKCIYKNFFIPCNDAIVNEILRASERVKKIQENEPIETVVFKMTRKRRNNIEDTHPATVDAHIQRLSTKETEIRKKKNKNRKKKTLPSRASSLYVKEKEVEKNVADENKPPQYKFVRKNNKKMNESIMKNSEGIEKFNFKSNLQLETTKSYMKPPKPNTAIDSVKPKVEEVNMKYNSRNRERLGDMIGNHLKNYDNYRHETNTRPVKVKPSNTKINQKFIAQKAGRINAPVSSSSLKSFANSFSSTFKWNNPVLGENPFNAGKISKSRNTGGTYDEIPLPFMSSDKKPISDVKTTSIRSSNQRIGNEIGHQLFDYNEFREEMLKRSRRSKSKYIGATNDEVQSLSPIKSLLMNSDKTSSSKESNFQRIGDEIVQQLNKYNEYREDMSTKSKNRSKNKFSGATNDESKPSSPTKSLLMNSDKIGNWKESSHQRMGSEVAQHLFKYKEYREETSHQRMGGEIAQHLFKYKEYREETSKHPNIKSKEKISGKIIENVQSQSSGKLTVMNSDQISVDKNRNISMESKPQRLGDRIALHFNEYDNLREEHIQNYERMGNKIGQYLNDYEESRETTRPVLDKTPKLKLHQHNKQKSQGSNTPISSASVKTNTSSISSALKWNKKHRGEKSINSSKKPIKIKIGGSTTKTKSYSSSKTQLMSSDKTLDVDNKTISMDSEKLTVTTLVDESWITSVFQPAYISDSIMSMESEKYVNYASDEEDK